MFNDSCSFWHKTAVTFVQLLNMQAVGRGTAQFGYAVALCSHKMYQYAAIYRKRLVKDGEIQNNEAHNSSNPEPQSISSIIWLVSDFICVHTHKGAYKRNLCQGIESDMRRLLCRTLRADQHQQVMQKPYSTKNACFRSSKKPTNATIIKFIAYMAKISSESLK